MSELTCLKLDEVLAAFAADALEPDERAATAMHLAECRNHDDELRALRRSFDQLSGGVSPVSPPPSLRSSLLDAFDREVAGASPDVVESLTLPPQPTGVTSWRQTPAAWFGYALAAGLLVVAIGLGAWGASRDGGEAEVVTLAASDAAGALRLTYIPARGLGVIDVELEALESGRTYQAWRIDNAGDAVSLGVLPITQGRFALEGDLRDAALIALSVEPAGGSASPTGDPILVTSLN